MCFFQTTTKDNLFSKHVVFIVNVVVCFSDENEEQPFSKHVVFIVNVVVCFSDENSFRSTYTRLYV